MCEDEDDNDGSVGCGGGDVKFKGDEDSGKEDYHKKDDDDDDNDDDNDDYHGDDDAKII